MDQNHFVDAIQNKKMVRLTFISKENGQKLTRTCAPMDFGPRRLAQNQSDRYHLWDFESDHRHHILSLLPERIVDMEILGDEFSPSEFVSWPTNWFVKRDWGKYS
ncbi:hypothetical protein BIT28_15875 [Photobacterium proteolyticum]|uniref:WYL domain-containing protein n=1 Tax=Photobacterium proteolyticum TaxID=1903952 RepID=A0A1Q9GYX2_9GAMM|nr:hypothetical protein [Photobacterium proteolyticum]OLQ80550.1 hypothetical protein BIT28_15875 [Photobacterium proteolyticum]